MAKKDYVQPSIEALEALHEPVLAASNPGAAIPGGQFGGDEPDDDTAEEKENLF